MSPRRSRVLLVEDDPSARFALRDHLDAEGWDVAEADSVRSATARFEEGDVDAVITDHALPDGDSLALLERFKSTPDLPVIVLTGYGTIDLAVKATRRGADHFLTKPVALPAIVSLLRQALARKRTESDEVDPFLGSSERIRRLRDDALRLSAGDCPALIVGPPGSGKGGLARWLHDHGPRSEEPFLDCAGLEHDVLEEELFGRGAAKVGLFEAAHRGTLFVDDIGDIDPDIQAKLLKVIDERKVRRAGDLRDRHVDVRLIAATRHSLPDRVREGRFRSDLWLRISALPLAAPSLRERPEDIPLLADRMLIGIAREVRKPRLALAPETVSVLLAHDWPGNLRELRNVLERAALHVESGEIGADSIRFDPHPDSVPAEDELTIPLREIERRHIERVLAAEGGHIERAAARLGIARSTLYDTIRRMRRR